MFDMTQMDRCMFSELSEIVHNLTLLQAFLSAAHAIRCTGPCSISTCYTTAAITHYKPPSVLPPAKSVIEDEMRRNTFWIGTSSHAYTSIVMLIV